MSGYNKAFNKSSVDVVLGSQNRDYIGQVASEDQNIAITPITQNVWKIITGSYVEHEDSKGWFTLSDATSGELTYTGPSGRHFMFTVNFDYEVTTLNSVEFMMRKNGADISSSFACSRSTTVELNANRTFITGLDNGDILQYWLRNIDGNNNVTIRNHNMSIVGA